MNISFIKYKISLIHYHHLAAHRPEPMYLDNPGLFSKEKLNSFLSEVVFCVTNQSGAGGLVAGGCQRWGLSGNVTVNFQT